jgi:acyl-CoA thioesterase FadM
MIEQGFEAVTLETHIRYRQPTRFDDELRVWTRIAEPGRLRARFRFEYALERMSGPQEIVADGWTSHTTVDAATLSPVRMPDWLREAIRAVEPAG